MQLFSLMTLIAFSAFLVYYCETNLRSSMIKDSLIKQSPKAILESSKRSANISSMSEFSQIFGSSKRMQIKPSEPKYNIIIHLPTPLPTTIKNTTYPSDKSDRLIIFLEIIGLLVIYIGLIVLCIDWARAVAANNPNRA